jgi:DNA polymerase I-like protein with 3'-5' exonuclease and polymerase domains
MWRAPSDIMGYYCGLDAASTYQLLTEVFLPSIKNQPYEKSFLDYHSLFIENVRLHASQQLSGATIDKASLEKYHVTLLEGIKNHQSEFLNHPEVRPHADAKNAEDIRELIEKEPTKYKKVIVPKEPKKHKVDGTISKNYIKWQEKTKQLEEDGPQLTSHWLSWEKKVTEARQMEHLNPNSGQQMRWLFYERLGFPIIMVTKSGQPSTGTDALPGFGEVGKLLKQQKDTTKEESYVSACLDNLIEDIEGNYRIHPQFKLPGTLTCRLAGSGGLNCLHPDTEYLTPEGWVQVSDLKEGQKVWQVDPSTTKGSWVLPSDIIKTSTTEIISFGGDRGALKVTPEHRMAWYKGLNQGHTYWETTPAKEEFTQKRRNILHSSNLSSDFSTQAVDDELRIALMLQADGSLRKNRKDIYTLGFTKERKIKRASKLLNSLPVEYGYVTKWNYIKFKSNYISNEDKRLNLENVPTSPAYRNLVLHELAFWDGHSRDVKGINIEYSCTDEYNIDEIMSYLSRSGVNVSKRKYRDCFRLYITDNLFSDCRKDTHIKKEQYVGPAYCVTVPTGHLLVRAGGRCWVTGNCQQLPKSKDYLDCWRPKEGKVWITYDFTALEQVVLAELSGDPALVNLYSPDSPFNDVYLFNSALMARDYGVKLFQPILDAGYDPDNPDKETISNVKKKYKNLRGISKVASLGKGYGMGWRKFQLNMTIQGVMMSDEECQAVIQGLDKVYKGVGVYRDYLLSEYKKNNGYIINGMGRPVGCEESSLKDIVNRQVQSTGHDILMLYISICDQLFRKYNLQVDGIIWDFHDESIVECDTADAKHVCHIMETEAVEILNKELQGTLPLQMDGEVIKTLADAKVEG